MDPVLTFVENQPITTENKTNSSKTATGYSIAMSYAILPEIYHFGISRKGSSTTLKWVLGGQKAAL